MFDPSTETQDVLTDKPTVFLGRIVGGYRLLRFESVDVVLAPILRCMLAEVDDDRILSLTITQDEVSLIIDEERYMTHYKSLRHSGVVKGITEAYTVLKVDTPVPGLGETGILARVTEVFAAYEIPVFCLSTFLVNYIFIPKENENDLERLAFETEGIILEPFQ